MRIFLIVIALVAAAMLCAQDALARPAAPAVLSSVPLPRVRPADAPLRASRPSPVSVRRQIDVPLPRARRVVLSAERVAVPPKQAAREPAAETPTLPAVPPPSVAAPAQPGDTVAAKPEASPPASPVAAGDPPATSASRVVDSLKRFAVSFLPSLGGKPAAPPVSAPVSAPTAAPVDDAPERDAGPPPVPRAPNERPDAEAPAEAAPAATATDLEPVTVAAAEPPRADPAPPAVEPAPAQDTDSRPDPFPIVPALPEPSADHAADPSPAPPAGTDETAPASDATPTVLASLGPPQALPTQPPLPAATPLFKKIPWPRRRPLTAWPRPDDPVIRDVTGNTPEAECDAALNSGILVAERMARLGHRGACYVPYAVKVRAIMVRHQRVDIVPPAMLRCGFALAVANWVRADLAPATEALGAKFVGLRQLDSYNCRHMSSSRVKMSEHSSGNALDVAEILFANHRPAHLTDRNTQKGLRARLRQTACKRFKTVLGPGVPAHNDHIHIDLRKHFGSGGICHWNVL